MQRKYADSPRSSPILADGVVFMSLRGIALDLLRRKGLIGVLMLTRY